MSLLTKLKEVIEQLRLGLFVKYPKQFARSSISYDQLRACPIAFYAIYGVAGSYCFRDDWSEEGIVLDREVRSYVSTNMVIAVAHGKLGATRLALYFPLDHQAMEFKLRFL